MTISDLLEHLQDAADAGWGDADVRLALHPQFSPIVSDVSDASTLVDGVFYIAEGQRLGFLSDKDEGVLVGDCQWGADIGL